MLFAHVYSRWILNFEKKSLTLDFWSYIIIFEFDYLQILKDVINFAFNIYE